MLLPSFVITLNDTLGDQEVALEKAGIYPKLVKGVNGKKDEHVKYADRIDPFCLKTCPKSMIGCGLSHILLCEQIYKSGIPMALILEDDAYPIEGIDMSHEITKVLNEVPDDWEVIKLHCDAFCKYGSNSSKGLDLFPVTGSTAAYIVNNKSAKKISEFKVQEHIDKQQYHKCIMYKSKYNLFRADETTSTNAARRHSVFTPILNTFVPITSGEKTWDDILGFKSFKIPFTNINLTNESYIWIGLLVLVLLIVLILA
jgi:hypothetical protein